MGVIRDGFDREEARGGNVLLRVCFHPTFQGDLSEMPEWRWR